MPPGKYDQLVRPSPHLTVFSVFQETGATVDQIFFWYEKCRQFFGPALDDDEEEDEVK